jgi:hypothetical protein
MASPLAMHNHRRGHKLHRASRAALVTAHELGNSCSAITAVSGVLKRILAETVQQSSAYDH